MTLAKLAKLAGVSVSTVSKAFSDSLEISEETKTHIFNIAKETGCFEKYFKPKYAKKLIAVICPELLGIHYSQMVTYIEKLVTEKGDTVLISFSNFSSDTQEQLIEYFTKFTHVDGIIVIEPVETIEVKSNTPIVQIGLTEGPSNVHCITVDMSSALDKIIKLLRSYGHSKIGFIGEKYTQTEFDFFKKYMEKNLLEVNDEFISINQHRFYDCGYFGMEEILKRNNLPTVIFAGYSHIAGGMLQKLKEEQINVPDDISIVCMNDIDSIPYCSVELSCIKMHIEELCSEAIRLLYRSLDNRYSDTKYTVTMTREFKQGNTILDRRGLINAEI
ncbi:MAG: LacI family DNA-binding transcriptional regulator [Monoglobales bacterium]